FPGRMDRCRQHSTIRANSCSRPVPLRRPTSAISLPARPTEETIVFPRRSPASELTFVRYGKERVKEWNGRPQKLPGVKSANGRSDSLQDATAGAQTQNIENNPMQSS